MRNIFLIVLFLLFSHHGYSQSASINASDLCDPEPLAAFDTLTRRIAIDSIKNLLIGEWELIEIQRGWSKNSKPYVVSKITFNKKGYTEYWENGMVVSICYTDIFWRAGYFWYKFRNLQGKKFIYLNAKNLGRLVICENKLGINNSQGDGEALLFRRLLIWNK